MLLSLQKRPFFPSSLVPDAFKLDENADPRWRLPLEHAGHFVSTVSEEALSGSDDDVIAKVCLQKRFALITVDQGFAQIIHYPTPPIPWNYCSPAPQAYTRGNEELNRPDHGRTEPRIRRWRTLDC